MELPNKPKPASRVNPAQVVIFGKPKCGKTEITSHLTRTGKWALLELERGGADYVEATTLDVPKIKEESQNTENPLTELQIIRQIGDAIIKQGKPYDGIIVDTVTQLETLIMPLACELYRKTPMGAAWQGNDVRILPKGAGYLYLRQAFFQVVAYIKTWAHNIIFLGHLSDKMIEKQGEEMNAKELDLTGKISKLMCAEVDAIAYCYRDENKTILNFQSSEEVVCGSRCEHLRGQKIVIAESDDSGKITTYWDKIYLKE